MRLSFRTADALVLFLLAVLVAWYCYDAINASSEILNLILVLPLSVAILVLCCVQFVLGLRRAVSEVEQGEPMRDVLPIMLLFTAYVLSLHWLGFDVGTSLFVGVFLWLYGERRLIRLAGYSFAFGFALSAFFAEMLPYPMPMLLLPTAY